MKMPAGSANSKEGEGAYIHTAAPRGSCAGGDRYFLKEFQPTGLTPHWTRGKARKEEAAETKWYGVTATPIPHSPVLLRGKKAAESEMKGEVEARESGDVRESINFLCFPLPRSILTGNKLNFSQV